MNEEQGGTRLSFDGAVTRMVVHLGQRSSRRGVLAGIGRFVLASVGVAAVRLVPFIRFPISTVQAADCNDWRLCGIYGRPCDCCSDGTLTTCPSNTTAGGCWYRCCLNPTDSKYYKISYVDCCRNKGGSWPGCLRCGDCTVGPPEPAWCVEQGTKVLYGCTIIEQGAQQQGTCGPTPCQ
jgi:hypothetical protein